jgi:general secretion pathway protein L
MAILVVQIPSRNRWRSGSVAGADTAERTTVDYAYVLSQNGITADVFSACAASLLPKADTVIAVLADADVGWHRITLPKAPAARLRAALTGVLEEAMLEDADRTHFAVEPNARGGAPAWVAAVHQPWLRSELAALARANVFVDRIVPSAWPDVPPTGHFAETEAQGDGGADGISLTWSSPDGVATLRLHGGLARAVIPNPAPDDARWSATPGAAAAAEHWLGKAVNVMSPAERLLQASRTLWNLRQFELARRSRGIRALTDALRQLRSPLWRPLRYGVAALAVVQIVGLNLWAWHQQSVIEAKRQAQVAVLQTAFPNVRAVLDAPLQLQREVQTQRTLAGKPGELDLEPMLQAAASAWPSDRPPVDNLRFEPGRLSLSAAGWGEPQIEQFRARLRPVGWQVEASEGRVTMTRAPGSGGTP